MFPQALSAACSEISLKGRNRPRFEQKLMKNMRIALAPFGEFELRERGGRVIALPKGGFEAAGARDALARTFGIDNVSLVQMVPHDLKRIEEAVLSVASGYSGRSIRVETRRSDKRFPMTSQEVSREIGSALVGIGCSVDLETPERTIYIDLISDAALVSVEKVKGPGGMPVGSSGGVLSLLSGGIDSPVASWLMMKRGCTLELLHLHASAQNRDVLETKIVRLAKAIRGFSPVPIKLTLAPYSEFYKRAMSMDQRYELVVFRRFMFRLASEYAKKHNLLGLVSGDSIGQVASQTLENIYATDEAAQGVPIFRPLATSNKQETIDIARKIGTYDLSVESYKDCCSLVSSRNPSTSVPQELARRLEAEIGIEAIVEKTLEQSDTVEF